MGCCERSSRCKLMTGVSARYRLGGYLGINGQKTINQSCHLLLLPLYNTPGVGWGAGGWGVQYAMGGGGGGAGGYNTPGVGWGVGGGGCHCAFCSCCCFRLTSIS